MDIDEKKVREWLHQGIVPTESLAKNLEATGPSADARYMRGMADAYRYVLSAGIEACRSAATVSLETGDGPGTVILDGRRVPAESAEGAQALAASAAGGPGHGPAKTGDGESSASYVLSDDERHRAEFVACMMSCPYFTHDGVCQGGCHEEPECVTGGPWEYNPAPLLDYINALESERRSPAPEGDTEEQGWTVGELHRKPGESEDQWLERTEVLVRFLAAEGGWSASLTSLRFKGSDAEQERRSIRRFRDLPDDYNPFVGEPGYPEELS